MRQIYSYLVGGLETQYWPAFRNSCLSRMRDREEAWEFGSRGGLKMLPGPSFDKRKKMIQRFNCI